MALEAVVGSLVGTGTHCVKGPLVFAQVMEEEEGMAACDEMNPILHSLDELWALPAGIKNFSA